MPSQLSDAHSQTEVVMSYQFEEIAERYLDIGTRTGTEWMCFCPFHENSGSPAMQFNVEKGLFVCFGCGEGGSAKKLVKKFGGIYSDPIASIEVLKKSLERLTRPDEQPNEPLPDSYLARFATRRPHKFWKEDRGFSTGAVKRWGLGYDPISDRATIPFRDSDGALRGVIYRRLDDQFPRYIYPKSFDRLGSLFGSWRIVEEGDKEAAIVEGGLDTVKVDQSGIASVAQYGSSIASGQVQLLRRIGIRRVTLFYDYDFGGRKAEAQAVKALKGFLVSKVVWDTDKYCWHEKLCRTGEHSPMEILKCPKEERKYCRCGRKHGMDPGKLSTSTIQQMYDSAVLIGRREEEWSSTRRSARRNNARKGR